MLDKGVRTSARLGGKLPLMAKKILLTGSASWTKLAISFLSIGSMSFSRFFVSSDKTSLEEMADELISSSSIYSSKLKE